MHKREREYLTHSRLSATWAKAAHTMQIDIIDCSLHQQSLENKQTEQT